MSHDFPAFALSEEHDALRESVRALAEVLTRAGWSVVIMEKGRNHLLDPADPTRPSGNYSNDEIKFISRYFLGPDPLTEPRAFRRNASEGEHIHVGEVNSIPTTVGGGGTRTPSSE